MSDPRELAAVVREAKRVRGLTIPQAREEFGDDWPRRTAQAQIDADAALDALVAECERRGRELDGTGHALANADRALEEMRRERDEAMDEWPKVAEALKARAVAAERERDEHLVASAKTIRKMGAALDRSHARARRYEEALRRIEQIGSALSERDQPVQHKIARAALAEEDE